MVIIIEYGAACRPPNRLKEDGATLVKTVEFKLAAIPLVRFLLKSVPACSPSGVNAFPKVTLSIEYRARLMIIEVAKRSLRNPNCIALLGNFLFVSREKSGFELVMAGSSHVLIFPENIPVIEPLLASLENHSVLVFPLQTVCASQVPIG